MAAPGFGFSVGDFIAGVSLVKKLIRALNDGAGSRAAYRRLISELLNLEEVLTEISKLQLGQAQESQRLTLKRIATQCESSIEAFLQKNCKFNDSLGTGPSATPPRWRANLHKIQWALCKDTAVDDLRTEIAAHTATLNVNLATIQVSATKLQEQCLDSCALLLQAVSDEAREGNARSEENRKTLVVHQGMLQTISRHVTGLVFGQEDGLLSLLRKGLQWNNRIFDAVTQIQQLLYSIPPQIEREQPVLFEDAHGRLTPFHVEFINSYGAFQAVLEARFENMPGLRKVRNLEYAMQDTQSKQILDLSGPWENSIRPGRKLVMSMVFQMPKATISSCPGCSTETSNRLVKEGSDVQCDNPDCRLFYRCITDVTEAKPGKRKRSDSDGSPTKRMKRRHEDNGTDEDDQDGIHDFRRVQIVHTGLSSSTERPTSPESTTGRCIEDVYQELEAASMTSQSTEGDADGDVDGQSTIQDNDTIYPFFPHNPQGFARQPYADGIDTTGQDILSSFPGYNAPAKPLDLYSHPSMQRFLRDPQRVMFNPIPQSQLLGPPHASKQGRQDLHGYKYGRNNVYDNGETDITEQLRACRPGHTYSDPIVREYDRNISPRRSPDIAPKDVKFSDDVSGSDIRTVSMHRDFNDGQHYNLFDGFFFGGQHGGARSNIVL